MNTFNTNNRWTARQHHLAKCLLLVILLGFIFKPTKAISSPISTSANFELFCSEKGLLKYHLVANKVLLYENGDKSFPEGIYLTFYEQDQTHSAYLQANDVYFFAEKKIYTLTGNVVLKRLKEKGQLDTETLYWDPTKAIFYTNTVIKIETDAASLTGEGLVATEDMRYYKITKLDGLVHIESVQ